MRKQEQKKRAKSPSHSPWKTNEKNYNTSNSDLAEIELKGEDLSRTSVFKESGLKSKLT